MKKLIIKHVGLSLIIILLLTNCDYSDVRLTFFNHWNRPVSVEYSNDSIPNSMNLVEYYLANSIKPGESKILYKRGTSTAWLDYVKDNKDLQLYLYVYDLDTLSKYHNMDFIRKHKLYINKIQLTLDELNKSKWKINFYGPIAESGVHIVH